MVPDFHIEGQLLLNLALLQSRTIYILSHAFVTVSQRPRRILGIRVPMFHKKGTSLVDFDACFCVENVV